MLRVDAIPPYRQSQLPPQRRAELRIKAGVEEKKKRRENQYRQQLARQQLVQNRLLRDTLLEVAAEREREVLRLSEEVAEGTQGC